MIQVCNNADATTFYVCEKFLNTLIIRLEHNTALVVKWFKNNYVKLNKDKCHLRVFPRTYHVFSTLTDIEATVSKSFQHGFHVMYL